MRPEIVIDQSWRFPTPQIHRLSNGLTVWSFDLPGQHVVTAELLIPVCLCGEPRELEGLATLALNVCDEGSRTHPGGEYADLLESSGAAIGVAQGQYTSHIRLEVPNTRLRSAWPLLAEAVREPASSDADVLRHRDMLLSDHAQHLATPRGASSFAIRQALYDPADRRSRPDAGTPDTVRTITPGDVRDFQRRWWGPAGTTLIVAGDLPSGLLNDIESAFGTWRPQEIIADRPPIVGPQPRTILVDRPTNVQADVLIAGFAINRSDPRVAAAIVSGMAMSGTFSSRLNLELRERRGFTYGVGGGFTPGRHSGIFQVGASFRTDIAGDAVRTAFDLLQLQEPFTAAEISAAQANLLGTGPLENETASDIADQAAHLAVGGDGSDYLHRLNDAVARLTADQVSATFRDLVDPAKLSLAVAGPADILAAELESIGRDVEILHLP